MAPVNTCSYCGACSELPPLALLNWWLLKTNVSNLTLYAHKSVNPLVPKGA